MGGIIGKGGENIKDVTEQLRRRAFPLSRIILHPHSREEWETHLEEIKNNIAAQKKKGIGEE